MLITGPAGQLELMQTGDVSKGLAVLCHPHPLYGGSMYDHVLSQLSTGFAQLGIGSVVFNFRGVGDSEGAYAQGVGEVEDVIAVLDWARSETPGAIYLGGYSFGAVMAIQAAAKISEHLAGLVLVAPPISMLPSDFDPLPSDLPKCAMFGEDDAIASPERAAEVFNENEIRVLPDTDHFFQGAESEIIRGLLDFANGT